MKRQSLFTFSLAAVVFSAALPSCVRASDPDLHQPMAHDAVKTPAVITEFADRDKHVGEVVTVRGTLSHGKISTVLDVMVVQQGESIPRNLDGKTVEVTGKLEKFDHDDQGGRTQLPSGTYFQIDIPRGAKGVTEVK